MGFEGPKKEIHEGDPLRGYETEIQKDFHEGARRTAKGQRSRGVRHGVEGNGKWICHEKDFHEGHEERRRATKALEGAREGSPRIGGERISTKLRVHEGREKAKRFPRRATKNGKRPATKGLAGAREGARQGSPRGAGQRTGKGKKINSTKGHEGGPLRGLKRGLFEGSRKTKRFPRRGTKNGKGPAKALAGAQEGFPFFSDEGKASTGDAVNEAFP